MDIRLPNDERDWELIEDSLKNPKWDFRTVPGIAKETGLSEHRVADLLKAYSDRIRRSYVPDEHGRVLYTLREKPVSLREMMANTVAFIAKSPR